MEPYETVVLVTGDNYIQYVETETTVANLGGVRGVHFWRLVMYFCINNCMSTSIFEMVIQQWNAATTTRHSYTLTYQFLTDLQTFDYRPRYSVRTFT